MQYDPKDPWFYNQNYLQALSSWPGRTPEELNERLPAYVLILAAMDGDWSQVERILLSKLANVDDRVPEFGGTALWYAAHKGYIDLLEYLLRFKPDLTFVNLETGTTPYQAAVWANNKECIRAFDEYISKK